MELSVVKNQHEEFIGECPSVFSILFFFFFKSTLRGLESSQSLKQETRLQVAVKYGVSGEDVSQGIGRWT